MWSPGQGDAEYGALVHEVAAGPGGGDEANRAQNREVLAKQRVPAVMLGRAFSLVYGADQLAAVVSYGLAGPLVALAGPRVAFLVAGAGALAGLGILVPGLRAPGPAAGAPEPASL